MGKIVINQLQLNGSVVGYRLDVINPEGSRVVSFDVNTANAKAFLAMVNADSVVKGKVIKGREVDGVFVTPDESNVIEVSSKKSAVDLIGVYFGQNTTSEGITPAEQKFVRSWNSNSKYAEYSANRKDLKTLYQEGLDLKSVGGWVSKHYKDGETPGSYEVMLGIQYSLKALNSVQGVLVAVDLDQDLRNNLDEEHAMLTVGNIFFNNIKEYLRFIFNMCRVTNRGVVYLQFTACRVKGSSEYCYEGKIAWRGDSFEAFLSHVISELGADNVNLYDDGSGDYITVAFKDEIGYMPEDCLSSEINYFDYYYKLFFPNTLLVTEYYERYYSKLLHHGYPKGSDYMDLTGLKPYSHLSKEFYDYFGEDPYSLSSE